MSLPENVIFSKGVSLDLARLVSNYRFSQVAVIMDENTHHACYPRISESLPLHQTIVIKPGEQQKNLETCNSIWDALTQASFDRNGLLINLGGGVIGDMGGFCAAAYKRGIPFLNIPTTLLAQVDASVGGKLGIDYQGFKNHIGFFQDPWRILVAPEFLATLSERELRSGFAEVIKHALISDPQLWKEIRQQDWRKLDWQELIPRAIQIKADVVANDPYEKGLRKTLNFGHTIGHAVESYFLDTPNPILHGEAVAMGMIAEAYLSKKLTGLSPEESKEIEGYILSIFGKIEIKEKFVNEIVQWARQDKKNESGQIKCSLLNEIGHCEFNINTELDDIIEAITYYSSIKFR